jgi:hypothetical protein
MKKLSLAGFLVLAWGPGIFATTVNVSGGTGLQAAVNAAAPGDTIQITDSLNYSQDLFIDKPLTLVGTGATPPTITAVNTGSRGRFGALGNFIAVANMTTWTADDQGLYIQANNVTLRNLIIRNPTLQNNNDHAIDLPAALTLVGDNVTIDGCDIAASAGGAVDDTAIFVGEGNLTTFVGSPFAAQAVHTTNNLTIKNCNISGGRRGIYVPDIGAWLSDPADPAGFSTGNTQVRLPAEDAVVMDTVINVSRQCYQPIGAKNWTFDNCTMSVTSTSGQDVIRARGGSTTFVNCTIGSPRHRSINCQADVSSGGEFMTMIFDHCLICGGGDGREHNLLDDVNILFDHCIINSLNPPVTPGSTTVSILRRTDATNGIDQRFAGPPPFSTLPGRPPLPSQVSLEMNHCDLYNSAVAPAPFRVGIAYQEEAPPNQSGLPSLLTLTDSIITSDICLFDGTQRITGVLANCSTFGPPPYYPAGSTVTLNNNILRSANNDPGLRTLLCTGFGYTVDSTTPMNIPAGPAGCNSPPLVGPANNQADYGSNYIDRDPQYANIGDCGDPDSWLPQDDTLLTAGTGGGPVGSQLGAFHPPSAGIEDWSLYE